jgi:hypothetical protein
MFNRPDHHYQTSFFAESARITYDDVPGTDTAEPITWAYIRINDTSPAAAPIAIGLPYGKRIHVTP